MLRGGACKFIQACPFPGPRFCHAALCLREELCIVLSFAPSLGAQSGARCHSKRGVSSLAIVYGETVQQSGFSPSQLHEARAVSGVIFQPLLGTPLWMPGWVRDRAGSITVWSRINMVVVWGRFEPATILWYSVDPPNWHRSGRLFNALLHSSVSTGQPRSSLGVQL